MLTAVVPLSTVFSVPVLIAVVPVLTAVIVSILMIKNMIWDQQQLIRKGKKKYQQIFSVSQQLNHQFSKMYVEGGNTLITVTLLVTDNQPFGNNVDKSCRNPYVNRVMKMMMLCKVNDWYTTKGKR